MAPKKENLPVQAAPAHPSGGTITYANEVLAIISGIAANEIEGIAGMCTSGGFSDIIGKNRNITRGVKIELGTEEVSIDLYTIIEYGQPIQKVAGEVQENVRKSVEAMTGLKVVRVDVHVQGVSFEKEKREAQTNLESAERPSLPDGEQLEKDHWREDVQPAQAAQEMQEENEGTASGWTVPPQTEQTYQAEPAFYSVDPHAAPDTENEEAPQDAQVIPPSAPAQPDANGTQDIVVDEKPSRKPGKKNRRA